MVGLGRRLDGLWRDTLAERSVLGWSFQPAVRTTSNHVTVGVAGYGGGKMAQAASIDHLFAVSSASVHRVQEVQTTIYHVLWELTQRALNAA